MIGVFIAVSISVRDSCWALLLVTKASNWCFAWLMGTENCGCLQVLGLGSVLWLPLLELVVTYLETRLTITTRKIHQLWIIAYFAATFPSRCDILKCPVHSFLSRGIFLCIWVRCRRAPSTGQCTCLDQAWDHPERKDHKAGLRQPADRPSCWAPIAIKVIVFNYCFICTGCLPASMSMCHVPDVCGDQKRVSDALG